MVSDSRSEADITGQPTTNNRYAGNTIDPGAVASTVEVADRKQREGPEVILWHATSDPRQFAPRGGETCPKPGTFYCRAVSEQLNQPGRWRT